MNIFRRDGFTLIEILLSLLILSGAINILFGGFQAAEILDHQAGNEEHAAVIAERELELLKTDLLAGRRPPRGSSRGRFRLPGGWKSRVSWSPFEQECTVRMAARVLKPGVDLRLESFVYLPSIASSCVGAKP